MIITYIYIHHLMNDHREKHLRGLYRRAASQTATHLRMRAVQRQAFARVWPEYVRSLKEKHVRAHHKIYFAHVVLTELTHRHAFTTKKASAHDDKKKKNTIVQLFRHIEHYMIDLM